MVEFSTATFEAYLIFSYLLTKALEGCFYFLYWKVFENLVFGSAPCVSCAIAYCIVRPSIIFFTSYIHITHDASHQIGSKSDISIKRVLSPSRLLTDISVGCVVKVLDVLEAERWKFKIRPSSHDASPLIHLQRVVVLLSKSHFAEWHLINDAVQ